MYANKTHHMVSLILLLITLWISPAIGDELTLDYFIQKVITTNSKRTEMQLTFEELDAQRSQLKSERFPTLSYSLYSMELRQGPRELFIGSVSIPQPATTFNYYSTSLDIKYQLFDYGNSFRRIKSIDHDKDAAYYEYVQDSRDLILKTQEIFFQLAEAEELKKLYMYELTDLLKQIPLLESLVENGVKPAVDKMKFDIRLNELKIKIMSQTSQIIQYKRDLTHLMGEKYSENYTVIIPVLDQAQISDTSSNLILKNIPLLKSFESRIRTEELKISVIKWDNLPDIYLNAGYQRGSNIFNAIYSDFDKDWSLNYSLNLSFPLYKNRKAKLKETQKQLQILRLQQQYQDEKRMVEKKHRDLKISIQSDLEQFELYSKNEDNQESIYRYEYDRYTSGLSEYREMAEAKKTLLRGKQALISLKYKLLQNQGKLDVLSGKWDHLIAF